MERPGHLEPQLAITLAEYVEVPSDGDLAGDYRRGNPLWLPLQKGIDFLSWFKIR